MLTPETHPEFFRSCPAYPPTHLRNAYGDRLYCFVMRKGRRWFTVERFHPNYENARDYAQRALRFDFGADRLVLVYEVAPIGP